MFKHRNSVHVNKCCDYDDKLLSKTNSIVYNVSSPYIGLPQQYNITREYCYILFEWSHIARPLFCLQTHLVMSGYERL